MTVSAAGTLQYTDCFTGEVTTQSFTLATTEICSITLPILNSGSAVFTNVTNTAFIITMTSAILAYATFQYTNPVTQAVQNITVYYGNPVTVNSTTVPVRISGSPRFTIVAANTNENLACYPQKLDGFNIERLSRVLAKALSLILYSMTGVMGNSIFFLAQELAKTRTNRKILRHFFII
jgi:hypothetical protein